MSSVRPTVASLVLVAVTAVTAPAALRAQIVANGGFESGNAGWTFRANDCSTAAGDPNAGPSYTGTTTAVGTYARPRSGAYDLWMGAAGCTPSVSQSLATVSGQSYALDFWTRVNGALNAVPNQLTVTWNATTLFSAQMSDTTWQHMVFTVTGTGHDELMFAANNVYGGTELDDASLTVLPSPVASQLVMVTPEPRTSVLVATGLVGLVPVIRRRRR